MTLIKDWSTGEYDLSDSCSFDDLRRVDLSRKGGRITFTKNGRGKYNHSDVAVGLYGRVSFWNASNHDASLLPRAGWAYQGQGFFAATDQSLAEKCRDWARVLREEPGLEITAEAEGKSITIYYDRKENVALKFEPGGPKNDQFGATFKNGIPKAEVVFEDGEMNRDPNRIISTEHVTFWDAGFVPSSSTDRGKPIRFAPGSVLVLDNKLLNVGKGYYLDCSSNPCSIILRGRGHIVHTGSEKGAWDSQLTLQDNSEHMLRTQINDIYQRTGALETALSEVLNVVRANSEQLGDINLSGGSL